MFDVDEEVTLLEGHEDRTTGDIGTVVAAMIGGGANTQSNTYRVEFQTDDKYRPHTQVWIPEDKLERA